MRLDMKFLISTIIAVFLLIGCSLTSGIRTPAQTAEPFAVQKISKLKPMQILRLLKNSCCNGVFVEPMTTENWSQDDMAELQLLINDQTPSAPVVSVYSSVPCLAPKYTSTVGREAKHLLKALKEGRYPLSICSTYDLQLDEL